MQQQIQEISEVKRQGNEFRSKLESYFGENIVNGE